MEKKHYYQKGFVSFAKLPKISPKTKEFLLEMKHYA